MDETKLAHFPTLIDTRLAELARDGERGAQGQAVDELDQQVVGRLSRMDALQNQAIAKAQAARREIEVSRLRAALVRVDDGSFGACDDCGEAIPESRLRLDLATMRCVSCASG